MITVIVLANPRNRSCPPSGGFSIRERGIHIAPERWIRFEDIVSVGRQKTDPSGLRVTLADEVIFCGGSHITEQDISEALKLIESHSLA